MNPSDSSKNTNDDDKKLHLSRSFSFWFSYVSKGKLRKEDYENEIKVIGSFSTVEDFWSYYQHMIRPDKLPIGCKFALFQEGIKPAWEDKENQGGGAFYLRIKKLYANKFWEDLLLSYIGEQCEDNDDICGLNLNIKANEINIQIWTRSLDEDQQITVGNWIKSTLGLTDKTDLEYRHHPKEGGEYPTHKNYSKRIERNDEYKKETKVAN